MKAPKNKAINLLEKQLETATALKQIKRDSPEFSAWREMTETILANLFGQESSEVKKFKGISYSVWFVSSLTTDQEWQDAYVRGFVNAEAQLNAALAQVKTFWEDDGHHDLRESATATAGSQIEMLFERFPFVVRQLCTRYDKRTTLVVSDEYDAQDLLHALLKIFFDDIRPEEWTPSYAGGTSRMDFFIANHGIVIEVKKTRAGMKARALGDELIVDIMRYKAHSGVKVLFCFVYDPDHFVSNPSGLERDLSKPSNGLDVKCIIRPK